MADDKSDGTDGTNDAGTSIYETPVEYSQKLQEFCFINTAATFDGALKLVGVKSPEEFFEVLTNLTPEQFERLSEQVEELSALATPRSQLDSEKTETGFWD